MIVAKPLTAAFLIARATYYWLFRIFVAEPFFKAHCRQYGHRVHTDIYLHWVQGHGDIVLGDDILFDGKCSITFAARYSRAPTLIVGSGTGIGHDCAFTVANRISIGRNCRIASGVWMFDSPGHRSDPRARLNNLPADISDVKPITVGDNVWIGGRAIIFPGVTVGEGSVVSAGAVVASDVPAYSVVIGNPARRIGTLSTVQALS
jgi:acetyltransferase-like isoleucine patch superfamily enzyme